MTTIIPHSDSHVNPVPDGKKAIIDSLERSIKVINAAQDQIIEVRVLNVDGKNRTDSGYFNDFHKAAQAAAPYLRRGQTTLTLNPPQPALLSRSCNRITEYAKNTTSDKEIGRLQWLFIDCDPRRPVGISSSDVEHQAALDRATAITAYLAEQGWPEPIRADSGNGSHLLYQIDLPNIEENVRLIKNVLAALAAHFNDAQVEIDPATFNPARLIKLYDTPAQKGDNTPERPHRMSSILSMPVAPMPVTRDQLARLVMIAFPVERPDNSIRTGSTSKETRDILTNPIRRLKDDVLGRLDMLAYAEQRWGITATAEGNDYRIAGQGGLLINPTKACWRSFRDDHGGGPIDLCGYYLHGKGYQRDDPTMFREALCEAALFVGLDSSVYLKPNAPTTPTIAEDRKRLIPASEWLDRPPTGWLLFGILPKKAIGFIWGASGIGKSFLMLHLALLIAQTKVVIYIASEGEDGYGQRMKAWITFHKKGVGKLFFRQELLAVEEAEINAFIQQIVALHPELIIVDTFSAAMPGVSDNDAAEISRLSRNCRLLSQATGATVLGVHHPTKEGSTFRGSGAFLANFDFVMAAEELDGDLRVTCQKMREAEAFPEQRLSFLPVEIGLADRKGRVIVPSDIIVHSQDDALTKTQRAILKALVEEEADQGEGLTSGDLIAARCGSNSSVYEACRRLKAWGLIRQERRGEAYGLTEEGKSIYQRENVPSSASESSVANNRLFFPSLEIALPTPSDGDLPPIVPNSGNSDLTPDDSEKFTLLSTPDSTPNLSFGEVGVGVGDRVEPRTDDSLSVDTQPSPTCPQPDDPTVAITETSMMKPHGDVSMPEQNSVPHLSLSGAEREALRKLANHFQPHRDGSPLSMKIHELFQGSNPIAQGLRQALNSLRLKECLICDADGTNVQITPLGYAMLRQ